jgi:hypothetical protein
MKKTFTLLFIILVGYSIKAQIVNIPDTNFKNALISLGVDTNNNGEIEFTEAEAVDSLDISGKGIEDLTGIEAFINIEYLNCSLQELLYLNLGNAINLKTLDYHNTWISLLNLSSCNLLKKLNCSSTNTHILNISNCTHLEELNCSLNIIGNLDLSNALSLKILDCHYNGLVSLNLSSNDSLVYLNCSENFMETLNVPHNHGNQLEYLDCRGDMFLETLDLSYNYNLTYLDLRADELYEVCVWTLPFPPAGITFFGNGIADYIICNTNIPEAPISSNPKSKLYPNPTSGKLTINDAGVKKIEVLNLSGALLLTKENSSELNLTGYAKGIYLVKIYTDKGISVEKVIVN